MAAAGANGALARTVIPVAFDGCAGLLHPGRSNQGVVICGALGHETSATHRGLFELACALSSAGYDVLRFDYFGTGDSTGTGDEPDRLDRLEHSVRQAVAFLRTERAIGSVTLIGFRIGALLACLAAAERGDAVERIVLLDPVVSGRHYVRELRLLGSAWDCANGQRAEPQAGLAVVGERYGPDCIAALSRVDLRTVALPPIRLLIVGDDRFGLAAFEESCRDRGCDVTRLAFPELASYLLEPVEALTPRLAFASVVSWLGQPVGTIAAIAGGILSSELQTGTFTDQPFFFGPNGGLFGVLCLPGGGARPRKPTVVFVNTGVTRHTGDGRLFVEAARALAGSGVASFRFDLAGIGDSTADPGRSGLVYDASAQADVGSALDLLERLGHRDFAVLGICSGAHLALHVARADPRVTALVMVNLQRFVWSADQSLKVQRKRARRPVRYYLTAVLSRHGWARLLRGDLAVGSICAAIVSRPWLHFRRIVARQAERWLGVRTRFGSVRQWLVELADQRVDVRFWFGRDDQGVAELASWFGAGARDLRGIEQVQTRLVNGTDHAMQSRHSRAVFIEMLLGEIDNGLGQGRAAHW